ncbi:hypothetical protein ABT373_14000 [Streptomyces sp. NPDC000070]|uniref:hypothetical protein n=1 Tax=Streptomyces sp. NPDC000070 TaxID=3154240 RepID=UPI003329535D
MPHADAAGVPGGARRSVSVVSVTYSASQIADKRSADYLQGDKVDLARTCTTEFAKKASG